MKKIMPPEEVLTKTLFGIVLTGSFFFSWGKWAALIVGVLFLVSAAQGFCLPCVRHKLIQHIKKGKN